MIKIEITIPLFYNHGTEIEPIKFEKIHRELLRQFKRLTISPEVKGYWINEKIQYIDINKIYSIIMQDTKDNISWITGYKKWLEHNLEQKEIFITKSEVDIIK